MPNTDYYDEEIDTVYEELKKYGKEEICDEIC